LLEQTSLGEIFRRAMPVTPLEWTGERPTTARSGQEIEDLHRYFLARELCRGLDVLDVAAGEGYGAALLGQVARSVVGVEISAEAVTHAAASYRGPNVRFLGGDARGLPLVDACVDAVVSFETIEHFCEHDRFVAEIRRVLRPGGRLVVSTPERDAYSPSGSCANPHHKRELSRSEFIALMHGAFPHVHLLGQRALLGSALISDGDGKVRTVTFEKRGSRHFEASVGLPRPMYLVAIASDQPITDVPDTLCIETTEIVSAEADAVPDVVLADALARAAAAEAEVQNVRAEAASACSQRDIARMAARRAGAAAEGFWNGKVTALEREVGRWQLLAGEADQRADEAHRQAAEAVRQAAEANQEAEEWRGRYQGLRGRLIEMLRRYGILRVSRLVPASARRFVRNRLLGPEGR
jgi:SAM-dependent methyltransferase